MLSIASPAARRSLSRLSWRGLALNAGSSACIPFASYCRAQQEKNVGSPEPNKQWSCETPRRYNECELLAKVMKGNMETARCISTPDEELDAKIDQAMSLRNEEIEGRRKNNPADPTVARHDAMTSRYVDLERKLLDKARQTYEKCGGWMCIEEDVQRWTMNLYLKLIQGRDVGYYVLKETPDENGVPRYNEDIACLTDDRRNILYAMNAGDGKGKHWPKESILRIGMPETGEEIVRCSYYPFHQSSIGDAGAFLAELWATYLLYILSGGTGRLVNRALQERVIDPDGERNHRFGILIIENYEENLANGTAGINRSQQLLILREVESNVKADFEYVSMVTGRQPYVPQRYVVRDGSASGKAIAKYCGITAMKSGLGGNTNKLTEANIGSDGLLHRGVFYVEAYNEAKHGPFDKLPVNQARVNELKAGTRYIVRDGSASGEVIVRYDSIRHMKSGLGGDNSELTEANIGSDGMLHRGVFHVEIYDEEKHGPYDKTPMKQARVDELKAGQRYIVRDGSASGPVIMKYATIRALISGLGGRMNDFTEANIGSDGLLHRGVFYVEIYKAKHGPFDEIPENQARVDELKSGFDGRNRDRGSPKRYVVRDASVSGKVIIMKYDNIMDLHDGLGGGVNNLTEGNIGSAGLLHRGVFFVEIYKAKHGQFDAIRENQARVDELKAQLEGRYQCRTRR